MSEEKKAWGRRLKQARVAAKISQEQLGIRAGIDESVASARINRYETGRNQVDLKTAAKLAEVLGVPVGFFYEPDEELAGLLFRYSRIGNTARRSLHDAVRNYPGPPELTD